MGAAIAFIVSTTQQFFQRRAESAERQFQAFHELVKKVVSPEPTDGLFYVDRQAAVVFELRHFPRYYDFTGRFFAKAQKQVDDGSRPLRECVGRGNRSYPRSHQEEKIEIGV